MVVRSKVWYQCINTVCPICGRFRKKRVRVIDSPKPTDYNKTHIQIEVYDYCQEGEG